MIRYSSSKYARWAFQRVTTGKQAVPRRLMCTNNSKQPKKPPVWLTAEESPFKVRTLDPTPITHSLVSFSKSAEAARNSISWAKRTGREFIAQTEQLLKDNRLESRDINLSYKVVPNFQDGQLFRPEVMEDKWVVYHYDNNMYFGHSWKAQVCFIAETEIKDNMIHLKKLHRNKDMLPTLNERLEDCIDFIIKSYVFNSPRACAPLEGKNEDMYTDKKTMESICYELFGLYGHKVLYASQEKAERINVDFPLRSTCESHILLLSGKTNEAYDVIKTKTKDELESTSLHSLTTLHVAASVEDKKNIDAILDKGVDINIKSKELVLTPLSFYAMSNRDPDLSVFKYLIDKGADINDKDVSAFQAAASQCVEKTMEYLYSEHIIDVNQRDSNGFTMAHKNSEMNRPKTLQALLKYGLDVNVENGEWTPLKLAMKDGGEGFEEVISIIKRQNTLQGKLETYIERMMMHCRIYFTKYT